MKCNCKGKIDSEQMLLRVYFEIRVNWVEESKLYIYSNESNAVRQYYNLVKWYGCIESVSSRMKKIAGGQRVMVTLTCRRYDD